jgi:formylglycine-generating enzyme required for sulfatase activity
MQYIRGESLLDKINQQKKIPVNDAVRYTAQICDALEEVHRNNILHLDIKPGNILIDRQDNAKLIDFGVSKQYDDKNEETSHSVLGKSDSYAPMEQYAESGLAIFSPPTDIYALGATLYCMLTGTKSIPAPTRMHTDLDAPSTLDPKIPQALSDAVMKAMDVYVKNRYQSAAGFKAAIEGAKTKRAGEDTVIDDNIPEGIKVKPSKADTQIDTPPKPQPNKKKSKTDKTPAIIAGMITGLLALFILIGVFLSKDDPIPTDIPLVYVSGGTFTMGCTAEQGEDCEDNEKPAHQVTLDGFYIGKYEVTQAQWEAVMGANPSKFSGDNLPVTNVSWNDIVGISGDYMTIYNIQYYADGFIYKLNKLTGRHYRLPTEAEWEYAARGGASSRGYKYSGSNVLGNVAWYYDNSGIKNHHPVGTKSPNELGVYDMNGNVEEWCSDRYEKYNNNFQINPISSTTGSDRVIRGGGWHSNDRNCRVPGRVGCAPRSHRTGLGFRLACNSK